MTRMITLGRLGLAILGMLATVTLPLAAHNVFASFTRIDWNADDNSVELVMELHAHELEARLSLDLGQRLTFLNDMDYEALKAATRPLVEAGTALEVDGQALPLTYLGMQLEGQIVYVYMEADYPQAPKSLRFMNALLLDDLPGQVNSVMAVVNGERKAGEIRQGSGPVTFDF